MKKGIAFLLFAAVVLCACDPPEQKQKPSPDTRFPYNLSTPGKRFKLPGILKEISGIAAIDDTLVACVQDEKGTVYFFNLNTGKIESQIKFAGKGDYEDLTVIGNTIFVLDSKGTVFTIENYKTKLQVKSTDLDIEPPFELEGLCHRGDTLFAAAKYYHNKKRNAAGSIPVWRLSLPAQEVGSPIFSLPDFIDPDDGNRRPFHTSAMLFEENSREWLFLSTHDKMLLRCDYSGNIIATMQLPVDVFQQPEGICLTPSGDLLISNEGKEGAGDILLFQSKKNN